MSSTGCSRKKFSFSFPIAVGRVQQTQSETGPVWVHQWWTGLLILPGVTSSSREGCAKNTGYRLSLQASFERERPHTLQSFSPPTRASRSRVTVLPIPTDALAEPRESLVPAAAFARRRPTPLSEHGPRPPPPAGQAATRRAAPGRHAPSRRHRHAPRRQVGRRGGWAGQAATGTAARWAGAAGGRYGPTAAWAWAPWRSPTRLAAGAGQSVGPGPGRTAAA